MVMVAGLNDLRGPFGGLDKSAFINTASYVIWKEGNIYYAKNGNTGRLDYYDTDFSVVFNTVSAALNAVGGGSIKLVGELTGTIALIARSLVDVDGFGAEIVIVSNNTLNAVNFTDVVDSMWRNVIVRRQGIVADGSMALVLWGTTDSTVKFSNCQFFNETTGGSYCYGISVTESASPSFIGCTALGGGGGVSCFGVYVADIASPSFIGCTGMGGGGGLYCHGIYTAGSASPSCSGCTWQGGVGAESYGIYVAGSTSPLFIGCTGMGGGGGTNCYGILMTSSSSPLISSCTFIGGERINTGWVYTSANNGRFQPYAGHPYMLIGIYVYVSVAAGAGITLSLGNTVAGIEIATGIPIDSTNGKYFAITRTEQIADGYLYATPSGAIAEGSLNVRYVVISNYGLCRGVNLNTRGYVRLANSTIISNGASDAIYISDVAEAANAWRVTNCHIETMDPVNQSSIISQSAYANGPIYNCTLIGLVTNIVPAAGTAVGSNIQV